jgi:CRISPR system Cascade subunit CasD
VTTVLIRLDAPIQSWGAESVFEQRDTAAMPTKSGVVGLVAACLGRARTEPIDDLAAAVFAVRADQPGLPGSDYQTIGADGLYSADGRILSQPKISRRQYLDDAVFACAIGCPAELAGQIAYALRYPVHTPYLGRKSCPPAAPLFIATTEDEPRQALTLLPFQGRGPAPAEVRLVVEDPRGPGVCWDQPTTFHPDHRGNIMRRTRALTVSFAPAEDVLVGDDPYGVLT